MEKYIPVLLRMPLFSGVAAEDMPHLLKCLNAIKRTYPRGGHILRAGDTVRGAGILLEGRAQIYEGDAEGARTIVAQLAPGELFAESFACANIRYMPVSVEALSDCAALFVDCGRIVSTCSSVCSFHAQLIRNMVFLLAQKNVMQSQRIWHLSRRSTREKLLSYLREQAAFHKSRQFMVPFTRQELADYLCVDRSAMCAELSRLQKEGLLSYHKNAFKLERTE